jgi:hypothetical protein
MKRILAVLAAGLMAGCNDSESNPTTINEAPETAIGQTNGIIIMQDGSGNIVSVYAETDTGMYPITIDQVGTGNLAIVEIVRPPVIAPEPEEP